MKWMDNYTSNPFTISYWEWQCHFMAWQNLPFSSWASLCWLTALVWGLGRAWGCLLLLPLPERCSTASDLVSVLFDLNAVQLARLQSQFLPHFSPQCWNLSSHLVQKINIAGLIVRSGTLVCICKQNRLRECSWHLPLRKPIANCVGGTKCTLLKLIRCRWGKMKSNCCSVCSAVHHWIILMREERDQLKQLQEVARGELAELVSYFTQSTYLTEPHSNSLLVIGHFRIHGFPFGNVTVAGWGHC